MNDEIYACYLLKDYNYKCKLFKDFIELNDYYKHSNNELIIIPTKNKINYNRDELLKEEINKHITGTTYKNKFFSILTKVSLNINLD